MKQNKFGTESELRKCHWKFKNAGRHKLRMLNNSQYIADLPIPPSTLND